jgi:hypothetical protein
MSAATPDPEWQWATEGPQKPFAAAYATFRSGLREMWTLAGERELLEAHGRYVDALQSAATSSDGPARSERAYTAFAQTFSRSVGGPDRQRLARHAYERYLADVSSAWRDTSPETIAPSDLHGIASSMAWVAGTAEFIRQAAG